MTYFKLTKPNMSWDINTKPTKQSVLSSDEVYWEETKDTFFDSMIFLVLAVAITASIFVFIHYLKN